MWKKGTIFYIAACTECTGYLGNWRLSAGGSRFFYTNFYERLGEFMKDFITMVKCFFATMGGALGAVLGGWDGFLYALIVFVVVDYLTGVLVAVIGHRLSSQVGFHGIAKKVVIFFLVAVGYVIDSLVIQNGNVIRTAVIFFYLSNEGISILENVALMGLPVPQKLRDVLVQLKDHRDEE